MFYNFQPKAPSVKQIGIIFMSDYRYTSNCYIVWTPIVDNYIT